VADAAIKRYNKQIRVSPIVRDRFMRHLATTQASLAFSCNNAEHFSRHFPLWQAQATEASLLSSQTLLQQHFAQGLLWQSVALDGVQIRARYWLPTTAKASLVLIPGRIEAAHKYQELIYDLCQSGYQVFAIEHRGQGDGIRLTTDPMLGYVADFDDYVHDLALVMQQLVTLHAKGPLLLLAHSMGGAVLSRYLQSAAMAQHRKQHRTLYTDVAAIFCAPMWGIVTSPLPARIAAIIAGVMRKVNQWQGGPRYVPGQGPYQANDFDSNHLTHSAVRYRLFRELYQQHPKYQLGGVSWHWLATALGVCRQLRHSAAPDLPMLFLQAEHDTVVDNQAQRRLWQRWMADSSAQHSTQRVKHAAWQIQGARHEILFETDPIRGQAFAYINQFLSQLARKS
jgi:lysophospholipase